MRVLLAWLQDSGEIFLAPDLADVAGPDTILCQHITADETACGLEVKATLGDGSQMSTVYTGPYRVVRAPGDN